MPPIVATLGSVLLASVPAEIVNFAAKQEMEKDRKMMENIIDREEEVRRSLEKPFPLNLVMPPSADDIASALRETEERRQKDFILTPENVAADLVADVIKWLSYGVLTADFSGRMTYNDLPLFPGLESAWYGVIAALSAQIYADVFSAVFGFGGELKRKKVLSRGAFNWVTIYFQETISAAVLFGVYEFVQIPATAIVSAVLSGAADNCSGSQDYNLCMEAYLVNNTPGASPEAQLRSLVATLVSLWNKFSPDNFDVMEPFV